jgi:hypothetical protein
MRAIHRLAVADEQFILVIALVAAKLKERHSSTFWSVLTSCVGRP